MVRRLGVAIAIGGFTAVVFFGTRHGATDSTPNRPITAEDRESRASASFNSALTSSESQNQRLISVDEIARRTRQSPKPGGIPPEMVTLMADLENLITSGPNSSAWTGEEIAHFKGVFAFYLGIKTAYENQLVRVVSANTNSIEFEIPSYPDAGSELKRMFHEDVLEGLDERKTLDPLVSAFIDHHFAYFGEATQRIRVTANTDPIRGRLYAITHSLNATDRLHRETGGANGGFLASTSSATLDLAQLHVGSYGHIASAVAKNFGDTPPTG